MSQLRQLCCVDISKDESYIFFKGKYLGIIERTMGDQWTFKGTKQHFGTKTRAAYALAGKEFSHPPVMAHSGRRLIL